MKKIVIIVIAAVFATAIEAKKKEDPTVMTIAGKDVPLSEFIFMAKKDNSVNLNDKKSVNDYVELFKNYKLKIADAEAQGLQESDRFQRELEDYKRQLQESILADKVGEDTAIYEIYERMKYIPSFKYIMFRLPQGEILPSDTVVPYQRAMAAYERLQKGEPFEEMEEYYRSYPGDTATCGEMEYVFPLQLIKVLEDKIFTLKPGEIAPPVRSQTGYQIIKVIRQLPNPGQLLVEHILTKYASPIPTEAEKEAARKTSDSLYALIKGGANFEELARTYSADSASAVHGGLLPQFGPGKMVVPFEVAAYALKDTGEISKPVETRYGYHIIKLLAHKKEYQYEEVAGQLSNMMKQTDRNFDLYRLNDEKMKAKHNYIFYPEAYAELEKLANEYFPTDTAFYYNAMPMEKVLFRLDSFDFHQNLFVDFMAKRPTSAKKLSTDFMREIYNLFVRHICTEMERERLGIDFPDYDMLVKEYYDGILLFEISNKRIWSHPADKQPELEAEWLKEVNEKYPVKVNTKVLKKLKKYL
jgi:peptidyl-prolyl cis-trans isomerase SurA